MDNDTLFLGKHILTGCEYNRVDIDSYYYSNEQANTVDFILDGIEYRVTEDPNDGYRSSMKDVTVLPNGTVKNVFPECEVMGINMLDSEWEQNDAYQLLDTTTGKVVLEFGTTNYNDYYPMFIGGFYPENMAINEVKNGH